MKKERNKLYIDTYSFTTKNGSSKDMSGNKKINTQYLIECKNE